MDQLIVKLGIDWKLLLAQAVNFAILVYILQRYAFKPLMKSLKGRQEEIAKASAQAREVESRLKEAESVKHDILEKARRDGEVKVKEAVKDAARLHDEKLGEAHAEAERIIAQGAAVLEKERVALRGELKKDMGALVVAAVEKAVGDVIDEKAQKKLSDDALTALRNAK